MHPANVIFRDDLFGRLINFGDLGASDPATYFAEGSLTRPFYALDGFFDGDGESSRRVGVPPRPGVLPGRIGLLTTPIIDVPAHTRG